MTLPALEQLAQVTLADLVAAHAEFRGRQTAVIAGDRRVTWQQLDAGVSRVTNGLRALGIGRGDKVAVVMSNGVETLEVLLGINRAGAVIVPLSLLAAAEALERMIEDSGARVLFASHPFQQTVGGRFPGSKFVVGGAAPGWTEYGSWRDDQETSAPRVPVAVDDECVIIYSSGTTGLPKGIVHTHQNRTLFALSVVGSCRFTHDSVALATTPLYSNGTWLMFLPALLIGAPLVLMTKFEPAAFLDLVAREKVTHTFMVPPQFQAVLDHPNRAAADLSSLRIALSAGSTLRGDLKRRIVAELTPGLCELYGLTEGFSTMLYPEEILTKADSVGRPLFGTDIRIIDDEGRELPRGAVGEIAGFAGALMKGYHRRPEATAESIWIGPNGRTFLKSGDVGTMDQDGYLFIVDRKKDMILSGGFNVYPRDIEEVAARHPQVADVTVIGIPDPRWEEVPVAVVIPKPGPAASAEEIRDWINARVGKPQRVARVEFRDSFPRNALGKVLKKELRAEYGK